MRGCRTPEKVSWERIRLAPNQHWSLLSYHVVVFSMTVRVKSLSISDSIFTAIDSTLDMMGLPFRFLHDFFIAVQPSPSCTV